MTEALQSTGPRRSPAHGGLPCLADLRRTQTQSRLRQSAPREAAPRQAPADQPARESPLRYANAQPSLLHDRGSIRSPIQSTGQVDESSMRRKFRSI